MAEQGKVDEVFVEVGARIDGMLRAFKNAEKSAESAGKDISDAINRETAHNYQRVENVLESLNAEYNKSKLTQRELISLRLQEADATDDEIRHALRLVDALEEEKRAANELSKAKQKAARRAKEFADQQERVSRVVNRVKLALLAAAAAAATAAAYGMTRLVQSQLESLDAIAKTSDKLGIQSERLIELDLAARRTGVGTNTLTMALQRMIRRVSEAARGTGEAKDALVELGFDAQALAAMAPDEQFIAIAEAMRQVTNDGDQVRLAMRLFDSEGVALVNTLALGREGLMAYAKQARDMGKTLDREALRKVEEANDAISSMKDAAAAAGGTLAVELAPHIVKVADTMTKAIPVISAFTGNFRDVIMEVATLGGTLDEAAAKAKTFFAIMFPDIAAGRAGLLAWLGVNETNAALEHTEKLLARVAALGDRTPATADQPTVDSRVPFAGNLPGAADFDSSFVNASLSSIFEDIADQESRRLDISKKLHQSLREQTYTQRQLLEMELRMNGASDDFVNAQLAKYDALQNMIKGKREEAELDARAAQIVDANMTKEERLAKAIDHVNELKEKGKITDELAAKEIERQRKAIMGVAAAKRQAEGSATEGSLLSFGGALAAARNATQAAQRRMQGVGGAVANAGAGNQQQQQQAVRAATVQPVHDAKLFERVGEFLTAFNAKEFGGGFTA